MIPSYSTGVQIVSCTLLDDSVLSESTGLFDPVLCVSRWNLFWQKNQPIRLCLSTHVRLGKKSTSPFGDFNRPNWSIIKKLHWNMIYFSWHQSGPLNVNLYHCCAGKGKLMQCPIHNQKVNKPGFHGASCQLAPSYSQTSWTRKVPFLPKAVSWYQASVADGEWRWQSQQNFLNWGFNLLSAARVIDCTCSSGWGSSGWCAVLLITGRHF